MGYYCYDVIHPLIVNGEAILQVWRIGANMLNNQYLTVDKELSWGGADSSLRAGSSEKTYKCGNGSLDFVMGIFWLDKYCNSQLLKSMYFKYCTYIRVA
jgi:hypothetical protein